MEIAAIGMVFFGGFITGIGVMLIIISLIVWCEYRGSKKKE